MRQFSRGFSHGEELRTVDRREYGGKPLRRERILSETARGTVLLHKESILQLVRRRLHDERHKKRSGARRADFGHTRRAGAAEHEVRPRIGCRHILNKRLHRSLNSGFGVQRLHLINRFEAALMNYLRSRLRGQQGNGSREQVIEEPRTE